jgi:phage baseplate assembly protein W
LASVNIKYHPEDDGRDVGTLGIKLPMNAFAGGSKRGIFNMSYTTEEQSISNYIMLLLTRRGERYMQPEYGVGIQEKLFEPKTEILKALIIADINQQSAFWLPYIVNHSIDVNIDAHDAALGSDNESGIVITIVFSVTQSGANRTIVIFGDSGRTNITIT